MDNKTVERFQTIELMLSELLNASISIYGAIVQLWANADTKANDEISKRLDQVSENLRKALDLHAKLGGHK